MNIEKIFSALKQDEMNSAMGIIVQELESQGYTVELMDIPIKSEELFDGKFEDLERLPETTKVTLIKSGKIEQTFGIEFVDYHEVAFKKFAT